MKLAGAVLIVLGFLGLIFGGIPYNKTENIAQFGDLKMRVTEKKQASIPPVLCGVAILAGAVLMTRRGRSAP